MHVDKGKQGAIHEHSGNHGDDAGDAEQLMGRVQPANQRTTDDADHSRTCKRTYHQPLIQTDVSTRRTEIDEVSRAHADDASKGHHPHELAWGVEYHRETDGRNGGGQHILVVGVMGSHRQILGKIVDATHLDGKGDAKSHGQQHHECVNGARHAHLGEARQHVAHKIDEWHARHDKQRTGQQRVPWGSGYQHLRQPTAGLCSGRQQAAPPGQERGYKGGDADVHVGIAAFLVQIHAQAQTDDGSQGSIEKSGPVAAELDAETTAGQSAPHSYLPGRVVAFLAGYVIKLLPVAIQLIMQAQRFARQVTHLAQGVEINAMPLNTLELGERALAVTQVYHQHVINNVDM